MSQNVSLWGAVYSAVPSLTVPKQGGGTASFTDVTPTTATASDVASGKIFFTSAGVQTTGTNSGGGGGGGSVTQDQDGYIVLPPTGGGSSPTLITKNITANGTYNASSDSADGYSSVTVNVSGGGGDIWTWMGKNPTKVKTWTNEKVYLENSPYATWTPTTGATTLVSSAQISSDDTYSADYDNYDYIVYYRMHTHFEYGSGATQTALISDYYADMPYYVYGFAYSLSAMTSDTTSNFGSASITLKHGLFYKNASGQDSYATTAYGVYALAPSSPSSASGIRPYTLGISARCSNTHFSTSNAGVVNQSTSYYEIIMDLWQIDRGTSACGATYKIIRDMWINGFQ